MSPQALKWARQQRTGGAAEYAVLLVLAIESDRHGMCGLSTRAIADEISVQQKTVTEILGRLATKGLISWTPGVGRAPNVYQLPLGVVTSLPRH